MTEFVLEILDGDRAGEIFELASEPLTFGRRQGNDIVLKDEKCSGRHAQVVLEEGSWVLRDLDSTNGTLMDGRKIDEVGLTANDIFQVGITRVAFKEKGAPTPRNDLSVRKLDEATLAKTKRGGGVGALLVLVLLLGGAAVWYFYLRGDDPVGIGGNTAARERKPIEIPGNMLTGGDFEADESKLFGSVAGLPFTPEFGASMSHTGAQCYVVRRPEKSADDEAVVTDPFGLARTTDPVTVAAGGAVTAKAYVQTVGGARAALRVRFTSTNEDRPQLLFTGTAPKSYETYTEVSLSVPVPAGCDRAQVELLGLVPDKDDAVALFDDVGLVSGGDTKASSLRTAVGHQVAWTGTAVSIVTGQRTVLFGVDVTPADAALSALARAGLLAPSDLGLALAVKDEAGALDISVTGGSVRDLTLRFEPGIAAAGVLTRKGKAPFANQGTKFQQGEVDALLLGYGTARFLIEVAQAGAATAEGNDREYRVTLSGAAGCKLRYDFKTDRDAARGLLAEADTLVRESEFKSALDKLTLVTGVHPHDDVTLGKALALRQTVRNGLSDAIGRYEKLLDEATYFGSLRGYRRIRDELDGLITTYGREHIQKIDQVDAMLGKVGEAIGAVEKIEGQEARQKLKVLATVYGESDKTIGKLIADYIKEHLPPSEDPPNGEGKDDDEKENG